MMMKIMEIHRCAENSMPARAKCCISKAYDHVRGKFKPSQDYMFQAHFEQETLITLSIIVYMKTEDFINPNH